MKAVRIHGAEDLRVEDLTAPTVEPGKVLLEGGFNGICGSDLHFYYEPEATAAPLGWNFNEPAELTGAQWPQILGHEFSGTVSAVGEGVTDVKVGDNVAFHYCGHCEACSTGSPNVCPHMAFEGIQGRSGGLAEVKIVDAAMCHVLPDGVSLELGALVEPMAVAYHGVKQAHADEAECAVILGGGPIGVGAFFALKTLGVKTIIVSEPSESRRETLRNLGVVNVIDPTTQDLAQEVRSLSSDGHGAEVVIDCAGAPAAFGSGIDALRMNGRMVVVAGYERPVELHPMSLGGTKSISNSLTYTPDDFQQVIKGMAAGNYTTDGGWISISSMDDVERAIHQLRQGDGMKILVDVSKE
jgi:(R,R)-butanediol dehydrogenase/meso-butanediol dehydrogenase/diacetyl reductase